jgi:alkyl hydroperoxide reductase subunit AhpC
MDQFAQLRDRAKEFEERSTQVFFVLPEEPAYIRQWLRGRDRWATWVPEFFEDSAEKHPWLRSLGSGSDETKWPVLADPSGTTSADYGWFRPTTFIIDQEGIIRFEYWGKGSFDRPPVDRLLETIDGFKRR